MNAPRYRTGVEIETDKLVRACLDTRSVTDDQIAAIVGYICGARISGENSSVWHATAAVLREGKNCNCAACVFGKVGRP